MALKAKINIAALWNIWSQMKKVITANFMSTFEISRIELWNMINNFEKLNHELFPVLKMNYPNEYIDKTFDQYKLNEVLFISSVYLFQILPIDRYNVKMKKVIKYLGFIEESNSIFTSKWKHIRKIKEIDGKSIIHDKLEVTIKNVLLYPFIVLLIQIVFKNRHNRIRKIVLCKDDR